MKTERSLAPVEAATAGPKKYPDPAIHAVKLKVLFSKNLIP
jgi:hypothetical protein